MMTFTRGRPPLYDWDTLLNGEIHTLVEGKDFHCKESSFRHSFHCKCRRYGMKAHTKVERRTDPAVVYVQAYDPEEGS